MRAIVLMLCCFVGAVVGQSLEPQRRLVAAWNELGDSMLLQTPTLTDLSQDYKKYQPMTTVLPDDLRAAQRERRVKQWNAVINEQERQLKLMKQIRALESQY